MPPSRSASPAPRYFAMPARTGRWCVAYRVAGTHTLGAALDCPTLASAQCEARRLNTAARATVPPSPSRERV